MTDKPLFWMKVTNVKVSYKSSELNVIFGRKFPVTVKFTTKNSR